MKFRIISYYDRYKTQVFQDGEYINIGSPTGYYDIDSARTYCRLYKSQYDSRIIEEFEL